MKSTIKKRNPNKGFTLIEILVVIGIIATLAAISIPILTKVFATALDTKATSQMKYLQVLQKNLKGICYYYQVKE